MSISTTELAPGYRASRLIKGCWQLAGGHGEVDQAQAVLDMAAFVEAGLTAMLVLAGVPSEKALLAVLAYRIASYWLPLPAGLGAHFVFRHRYGKKSTLPEADATPSS